MARNSSRLELPEEIKAISEKPGKDRTNEEKQKVREWLLQSMWAVAFVRSRVLGCDEADARHWIKHMLDEHFDRFVAKFDPQKGSFEASIKRALWLYVIYPMWRASNKGRPKIKGEYVTEIDPIILTQLVDPSASDPAADLERKDTIEHLLNRIEHLLNRLDPRERQVIIETYFKGSTDDEIAEKLGISEGHVRVIRFHALRTLRTWMEEEEAEAA